MRKSKERIEIEKAIAETQGRIDACAEKMAKAQAELDRLGAEHQLRTSQKAFLMALVKASPAKAPGTSKPKTTPEPKMTGDSA